MRRGGWEFRSGRAGLRLVRRQLVFQNELDRAIVFDGVAEFAFGGGEDRDNFAGAAFTFGDVIANCKFGN